MKPIYFFILFFCGLAGCGSSSIPSNADVNQSSPQQNEVREKEKSGSLRTKGISFDYKWAEAEFSKSPYATLDTLRGVNVVWLLTGIAKPGGSVYDEGGKLPEVYQGKNAFREYTIWFTPAHNGPPYEIDGSSSRRYFEEDKKTPIADSAFYPPSEDWRVDYYTRDGKRFNTDVYHFIFTEKCDCRETARITAGGFLLVKWEMIGGANGGACADLQMFSIYRKK
jgi:hypothetical protein